jgi:hypothetical protein
MRPLLSVFLALSLLDPLPAGAWWETGHQTVARIAAAHLTPAARARIAHLLDVPDTPESLANALAKASTWADETKNATKTGEWHYIDLTLEDRKSDIPARCKDNNCAPARIRLFAAQLAPHPSDSSWSDVGWSDQDALRFLVHFVGDIHQPLHTIDDADLGGNCELLDPQVGRARNLHALWDGEIVNAINPDDKSLAAELENEIAALPAARQQELARGNQDDWVWESHELAARDIYHSLHIPTEPVEFPASCKDAPPAIVDLRLHIQTAYIDEMKPVVREQLEKAGLRLAELLNRTL